jgi:UDP-N-acetylglucosamine 1-carboxyvinyltransferase
LCATDLRGGAALIVAALAAQGVTEISKSIYIDRGYEDIEHKLTALGAQITRRSEEDIYLPRNETQGAS